MKIAVLKEGGPETRVAAIPETVKKFVGLGAGVAIETGAGQGASIADGEYEAAGATVGSRAEVLKDADIILCVTGPEPASIQGAKKGTRLIGALDPTPERIEAALGKNLRRLAEVKARWDPDNVFRTNRNITPRGEIGVLASR